uniref:Putative endonuclease n=1 Tax=Ixodes ricinus TaxID=34613 RepID=A0A0K8RG30_IXORI
MRNYYIMWHPIRSIVAVLTLLKTVNSDSVKHKHHVHCKNHRNQNVDWFVVYKLPKMNKIKTTDSYYVTPDGEEIAYFDSTMNTSHSPRWKQSRQSIYGEDNPVAYTLSPLFRRSKPTHHALTTEATGLWTCLGDPSYGMKLRRTATHLARRAHLQLWRVLVHQVCQVKATAMLPPMFQQVTQVFVYFSILLFGSGIYYSKAPPVSYAVHLV